jgi:hypothetical protein
VRRRALADDAALADAGVDTAAWLDDVDAADAQPDDLQRAVDHLLERQLKAQLDAAALDAQRDPQLIPRYRDLLARMAQVKKRLAGQPA